MDYSRYSVVSRFASNGTSRSANERQFCRHEAPTSARSARGAFGGYVAREFGGFAEGFAGLEDAEDGDVEVPAVVEIPQAECAAGTEMEMEIECSDGPLNLKKL